MYSPVDSERKERHPADPQYLKTYYGVGYRLIVPQGRTPTRIRIWMRKSGHERKRGEDIGAYRHHGRRRRASTDKSHSIADESSAQARLKPAVLDDRGTLGTPEIKTSMLQSAPLSKKHVEKQLRASYKVAGVCTKSILFEASMSASWETVRWWPLWPPPVNGVERPCWWNPAAF
jgi:hypothetical protein